LWIWVFFLEFLFSVFKLLYWVYFFFSANVVSLIQFFVWRFIVWGKKKNFSVYLVCEVTVANKWFSV
jgi:hypothetical protein